MATVAPDADSRPTPLRAMSIARFIPRFANPRLVTTNIPLYRHSFSLPVGQHQPSSSSSESPEHLTDSGEQTASPSGASYVEWSKLLPVPLNLLGSFRELFEPQSPKHATIAQDKSFDPQQEGHNSRRPASASPPPRLVFFGEQHHQPEVMRAQLQTLHALHQQCQLASQPESTSTQFSAAPIYRLHLILEHFSVLDQHMLNSFSLDKLGPDELAEAYQTHSQEAFHIGHYMPLLMLAKELHVPIWGGFPPRSWAKQVFRNGVESVKAVEQRRADPTSGKGFPSADSPISDQVQQPQSPTHTPSALPRSPLFTSWSAVTKIGAAHRSYLSGLMRPDMPPRFPHLPSISPSQDQYKASYRDYVKVDAPIYPTWLLKSHNIETKGFGPAQALKDSYLAHVTAWILRGARTEAPIAVDPKEKLAGAHHTLPVPSSVALGANVDHSGRPIVNIALVVCGLGHCEYGFGAPERVVELLSQQSSSTAEDGTTLLPYIIASKPLDSGLWLGYEHPSALSVPNGNEAENDLSSSTEQVPGRNEPEALKSAATTPEAVERWLGDPWGRKLADAVLLYDWIDNEPDQEASAGADGHPSKSG